MAQTFVGRIRTIVGNTFSNVLDLGTVADTLSQTFSQEYTNGTGSGKAQIQWHDQRSLNTATSENLDLAGGVTSAFGAATFTKIKELIIIVTTTTAGYRLEVGGAASNALASIVADPTDIIKIGAGGTLHLSSPVDGFTVTASTGDILKINNPSGGTITYDIIVIGEGSIA